MLKLIALLLMIWVTAQVALVIISLDRRQSVNDQFCTLDRTIVGILDPGYKSLPKRARSAIQIDLTSIANQAPCTITYIPLPKGTP